MPEYQDEPADPADYLPDDMFNPWFAGDVDDMTDEQIEEALETNVRDGFLTHAGTNDEGERLYAMTPKGAERAARIMARLMMGGDP
jgi:hypothetical protein